MDPTTGRLTSIKVTSADMTTTSGAALRHTRNTRRNAMSDLIFLALGLGAFGALVLYARFLRRA